MKLPTLYCRRLLALAMLVALAGCAGQPAKPGSATSDSGAGGAKRLTKKAKQALAAGKPGEAASAYLAAAKKARKSSLAARATVLAWHAGQFDQAKKAASTWHDIAPDAAGPHHFLGELALRRHDIDTAVRQFRAVLAAGKGHHDFLSIAKALTVGGSHYEAFQVMRRLEARHESDARAEYALALLAARAGHARLARKKIAHALELKPDWVKALALRGELLIDAQQPDKALRPVRALVKARPDDTKLAIQYADLLLKADKGDAARDVLSGVLNKHPHQPRALLLLALERLSHHDRKQATRYLTLLLETGKDRARAYYYLGRLAAHRKDYRMALDWMRRIDGKNRTARDELAIASTLAEMGKVASARRYLKDAREHFPRRANALLVGEAHLLADHGDADAGLKLLSHALAARSRDTEIRYARAMIADDAGHHQHAIADVKHVLKLEPHNTVALNALGYMLTENTHQYDRARGYIEQALRFSPHNAAIIDSLGWVQYHLGEASAAAKTLGRAHRLTDDPEISAHLVIALRATGQHAKASRVLRKALEHHPQAASLKKLKRGS
jgi:Flp pilus assembly protein TadD